MTIARSRFLCGAAAAFGLSAVSDAATLEVQVTRGHIDVSGRFGSELDPTEFANAPRALTPAILALFASQAELREGVKNRPGRHVLSGLPPVSMQGTNKSLGFPGSCEAQSFGYGLGTYTAARGAAAFNPQGGASNRISPAWLFAWAQKRQGLTTCGGSKALPYLQMLVARGAPSSAQVPYQAQCAYIQDINTNIAAFPGVAKFAIGSYKALPNFLNKQSQYLTAMKQYLYAGHAIAFSGLVAKGYDDPGGAMKRGAYAPSAFIPGSGHGQLIVGYDDSLGPAGAFLIQNSFGTAWPYLAEKAPLLQGRLWWTYEAFFASQGFGSIAYAIPRGGVPSGAVRLTSPARGAPAVHVVEAVRGQDAGRPVAAVELALATPLKLDALHLTPPGATTPLSNAYAAPIRYGFVQVERDRAFPPGRYLVELTAHTMTAALGEKRALTYRGQVTIR